MIGRAENYFIKDSYVIRPVNRFFDDTPFRDEFQNPVYEYAASIGGHMVIDVGCGSGFKLRKYFSKDQAIGVDLPQTVEWLRRQYPSWRWESFDPALVPAANLAICSDVIEHVPDPNGLIEYLKLTNAPDLIISTPERDLLKLDSENGPPRNVHHIREWNGDELVAYLGSHFEVKRWFITDAATQVVHCRKRK